MSEIFFTEKEKELYRRIYAGDKLSLDEANQPENYSVLLSLKSKGFINISFVNNDLIYYVSTTEQGKVYLYRHPELDSPEKEENSRIDALTRKNLELQNENLMFQRKYRWTAVVSAISVPLNLILAVLYILSFLR